MKVLAYQLKSNEYAHQPSEESESRQSFWAEVRAYKGKYMPDVDRAELERAVYRSISFWFSPDSLVGDCTVEQPHLQQSRTCRVPQFISLIVQVRKSGLPDANGLPLLHLIPEVQSWEPGADSSSKNALEHSSQPCLELAPCNNVQLSPETVTSNSVGINGSLAGLLYSWYHQVLNFAEQLRRERKDDADPKVIVELFLPRELILVVDLTVLRVLRNSKALVGRESVRTKSLVSDLNFVVRSLDRAETHVNNQSIAADTMLGRRLRKAREGSHVLLVTSPPPTYGDGDCEDDCPWQEAFDNRTCGDETAVCIYLAEHPSDPERMEHLLDDFINAHLPLTLLWHRNVSQDDIPADNRLSFAKEVLAMPRDQSLSLNSDQNGAFTQIHASLPNLNIETVALTRRKISISDHPDATAAKKAIILMDVHDHWPRLITRSVRDHPQDRLSSP